jgi:hypothetical protein
MYGIIINEEESPVNLNFDSAEDAAEQLGADEYMTNFKISEYDTGNGSYNVKLVLAGDFKKDVLDDHGLKGAKEYVTDLDGVYKLVKL